MHVGISVFREGIRTARTVRPSALYLSFLGMAIPLMVFRLATARWSTEKASEISSLDLTSSGALPLFRLVGDYASAHLAAGLVCALLVGWAYFFAIDAFASGFRKTAPSSLYRRLPQRFLRLLASAPILMMTAIFLVLIAQVLPFAAVLVSILWLMTPVLMLLDGKSALHALRTSLFLRFAPAGGGWRQFAFFRLMSLGFAVYASLMGIVILSDDFLKLDEIVPIARSVWLGMIPGLQLPLGFTIFGVVSSLLEAACLFGLALFTVSLYAAVRGQAAPASAPPP